MKEIGAPLLGLAKHKNYYIGMLQDIRLPVEMPGKLPAISTGRRSLFLVAKNLWLVIELPSKKGKQHIFESLIYQNRLKHIA